MRASLPAGRHRPVLPRARADRARALARARRLPRVDPPPRGRGPVRLLRGPADRQRPPGLAPRARARLQGRLPALQDDARPPVHRKAGWDCHGLPVELEVEKRARLHSEARHRALRRRRVQRQRAASRCSRYIDEWNALTERIGFWIDTDDAYFTLDNDYIESVWWSLKQVWEKGLLYEGHKVVPYCPRCGTALSSHEVALGYQDVVDPSRVRALPAAATSPGVSLLGWTTTPWTLLSQRRARRRPGRHLRARAARRRDADRRRGARRARARRGAPRSSERFTGSELVGTRYEPPFPYIADYGARGHTVLAGDFVTDRGRHRHRPHRARVRRGRLPARRASYGLTVQNPVRPDGTFDERIGPFAGHVRAGRRRRPSSPPSRESRPAVPRRASTSTPTRTAGAATRRSSTTPRRAGTSARPRCRDELLAANEAIDWYPDHIKHGRFGKLAREQRGLGAVARALLGHAAAGLALRARAHDASASARSTSSRERGGDAARGPAPALHRRGRASPARSAAARCAACPR